MSKLLWLVSVSITCVSSQSPTSSVSSSGPTLFQCNCGDRAIDTSSCPEIPTSLSPDGLLQRQLEQIADLMFSPPLSCDYLSLDNKNGDYLISPKPGEVLPFYVYCNFTSTNIETVIMHSSMHEIKAMACGPPRCSRHRLVYNAGMPQIVALMNQSTACRQYVKYRCLNTFLLAGYCGAWLSRHGTPQFYWGGATSQRDGYCACGEAHGCMMMYKKCNCDQNDYPETYDEGYLTDMDTLPVTELQFGDLDHHLEHGFHTVGPLICSGRR